MRIASGLLSGHVLQRTPRGATATVAGSAQASGPVTATITHRGKTLRGWKSRRVGAAKGGAFTAKLAGIPTGGPFAVTLAIGRESVVVRDVLVGDLWLMAGQSNMEGVGNIADAPKPHPLVRCFTMAHAWELARDPLHHLAESPDRVHNGGHQETPADAARVKKARIKGAGVGVWFARDLVERTGVPQGLIATAHGGTSMEQWDPAKRALGGESLYGSMLSSLKDVAQPLAGVLWYQGESDANPAAAAVYTQRMQALVAAVRADQKQPRLPWIVVQIGRFVATGNERQWNAIQEQQRRLPESIERLDVVAAIDLGLDDAIHIGGAAYATLGARMARAAARLAHGAKELRAPRPLRAQLLDGWPTGAAIEVRFADVVGGLRAPWMPLGFTLVDPQHRPVALVYKTIVDGDRVVLELSNNEQTDLRVMYGWGMNPTCNLVDGRGMAVPVFGPLAIGGQVPLTAIRDWHVSAIRPGEDIGAMAEPTPAAFAPARRPANDGPFVNLHDQWQGKGGHAAFFADVEFAEDMAVELRLGYDGPFRCWLDGREVHADLHGTNPAIMDKVRLPLRLRAGTHRLVVLMALNRGNAWGFFLRFARTDVSDKAATQATYAMPVVRG